MYRPVKFFDKAYAFGLLQSDLPLWREIYAVTCPAVVFVTASPCILDRARQRKAVGRVQWIPADSLPISCKPVRPYPLSLKLDGIGGPESVRQRNRSDIKSNSEQTVGTAALGMGVG